tara:strand:+ start:94 stop:792 length:699 start_codon:yes stop_codon:yes gene_type:complete
MSVFTYHIVKTDVVTALKAYFFPPKPTNGLIHLECMAAMTLGSGIFSPSRMLFRQITVFAQWENESSIDYFLKGNSLGKKLTKGWHTRLTYLRQWGKITEYVIPKESHVLEDKEAPVVAVTLARMKLTQVPRFIRWGRPVEKLVRDHPGITLALASIRLPRTVSTFSVWKSLKEMESMVHGHNSVPQPKRHSKAMVERERKDFHFEFTTLRFKPFAEFGEWDGRTNIIPKLK